jgi:dienelactone hydrolase
MSRSLNLSPSRVHQELMRSVARPLAFSPTHAQDLPAWRSALRARVVEALGLGAMPAQPPALNLRTLRKFEHEHGTIEKLAFCAEDGADVPCYLCVPNHPRAMPTPMFICLQGHSSGMHNSIGRALADEDTAIEVEGDRDFGLQCLARGIVALCVEQRGFGERRETQFGITEGKTTCGCAVSHALMLGRTLAGERVFDVQRAIDALHALDADRDELSLDFDRLGCMGNSGGGQVTLFAAAVDERIKLAMPSCYVCAWAASIMSVYHCPDNHLPGLMRWCECADVAGLIAPRPLVLVSGRDDPLFPHAGATQARAAIEAIYAAHGAGERVVSVIGEGGHRFYAEAGWGAMARWL